MLEVSGITMQSVVSEWHVYRLACRSKGLAYPSSLSKCPACPKLCLWKRRSIYWPWKGVMPPMSAGSLTIQHSICSTSTHLSVLSLLYSYQLTVITTGHFEPNGHTDFPSILVWRSGSNCQLTEARYDHLSLTHPLLRTLIVYINRHFYLFCELGIPSSCVLPYFTSN